MPGPSLYAAFDRFPSRKGAAIHIDRFARTLFATHGGGTLFVLGGTDLPAHQIEGNVEIVRFCDEVENFLDRALRFGDRLGRLVDRLAPSVDVAHFRDPWSGAPIALRDHDYATVYEVNALPSIELPHLFPALAPATIGKIRATELACCDAADVIVTPSNTTRDLLISLDVDPGKIRVIPNGADLDAPRPRPADAPDDYILYFGAPQTWQGIDTLLRAFARLADFTRLRLVICGSHESRAWKRYTKLASKLELDERIVWRFALEEDELAAWRQHAIVSVAPLTDSPRNVEQGCAPLKILESMASGVAVVASNVPPVREIIRDREDGWLVHPDRPSELARALRILLDDRPRAQAMGMAARQTIADRFTWERSTEMLRREYLRLKGVRVDGSVEELPVAQC